MNVLWRACDIILIIYDKLTSGILRKKAHKKRMLDLEDAKHNYTENFHISYSLRRSCSSCTVSVIPLI